MASFLPFSALAVTVEVKVEGIAAPYYDNILSRLGIYLHRESPRLSAYDIQRLHRQAPEDIVSAVAPYGYFSPVITSNLTKQDEHYLAVYTISLGEPVLVRNQDITIDGPEDAHAIFAEVEQQFPLQPGAVLDQNLYEQGKKNIIRQAVSQGFMTARFSVHELRVNRQGRVADMVLTLDTGPRFVFGETVSDQKIIRPDLLQRYIPYKVGEPYRLAKLIELRRTLYRTDYFSQVLVRGNVDRAEGVSVPVTVELTTPEHLNRYSLGLGYATDTGARGRFEWRNRLLNTRGHKLRGALQLSELENALGLTYEIPKGNPSNDTYVLGASYHDQVWEDTETRLFTAGIGLEHEGHLFRHGGSLEMRDEKYKVGVTEGHSKLLVPSFSGTLIWADNLLNTQYGLQLSLTVSGGVENVGSDTTFVKTEVGGKMILSPFESWRFIGRGSLGATLVDSINDIPPSLRFYAGGDQSIRGYGYKELGPEDSSGAVVGGRYLVVGSIEAEKMITEYWSLAAFWDVGNAMDDPSIDFKQGVGGGVRFRLPFGQVRLDLASAILEDGAPLRLHLSVGADL